MRVFPVLLTAALAMSGTVFGFLSLVDNPLNMGASFLIFSSVSLITVSGIAVFDRVKK